MRDNSPQVSRATVAHVPYAPAAIVDETASMNPERERGARSMYLADASG